ncbi:MAG: LysE family transporter [Candidatus Bathyarchaeia archaeon]|nr:LysE family transporter [Candidatus Bathyarchaeota archaeon]
MTFTLAAFLASVIAISLSGVMAPGPVLAVTVSKGRINGNAGAYIALGHGMIEIPLMIGIYFGFAQLLVHDAVKSIVGLAGGLMLLYMGFSNIMKLQEVELEAGDISGSSILAGVVATGANPYFILWWATIGVALVSTATNYGLLGFILFAVTHWSCDLIWDLTLSKTVNKSKKVWSPAVNKAVNLACSMILLLFGAWFIYSAVPWLIRTVQ